MMEESAAPSLQLLARPEVRPYGHAREQLADALRWVVLLLQRHTVRHSQRLTDEAGTLDDASVSLQEALHVLRRASAGAGALVTEEERAVEREIARLRAEMEARAEASWEMEGGGVEFLRAEFGLDERALAVLLVSAAGELSVEVERLMRFARADFSAQGVTVGFVAEVVSEAGELGCLDLEGLGLCAQGSLARQGLIELVESEGKVGLRALVRVPEGVLACLRGRLGALPAGLVGSCEVLEAAGAPSLEGLVMVKESREALLRALRRAARAKGGALLLKGATGVGRRTALRACLASAGQGVLVVDLGRAEEGKRAEVLRAALREARLRGCAVLARLEGLEGDGGALARVGEALKGLMGAHKGLVALSAAGEVEPLVAALGGVPSVRIEAPGQAAQEDMWRSAAAQLRRELPEASVAALAAGLSVTPGAIARAVRGAEEEGALDGEALGEQLARAARATMSHELEKLAERVEAGLRWEDAVLPDELREAVQEVIAHARHREQVLKGWGFGDKLPYGRGLSCLLSGPPGTGKTMLAGLLARSLGRPLYRVDVSRLVSKWLGETEKNLAALFREAARAQAILLFDEADSLFAKRTEVKSSQDRHANLEVNFLLQQMESFDGVTILTTNLDKGIDEAFLRRLRFRLHVGTPNEAERARLWRAMIPARAPLAGDVSFEALARALPLSGGHIKNAVVRAAFRAAAEGSALTHDLLYDAAAAEARENGMLVRA